MFNYIHWALQCAQFFASRCSLENDSLMHQKPVETESSCAQLYTLKPIISVYHNNANAQILNSEHHRLSLQPTVLAWAVTLRCC